MRTLGIDLGSKRIGVAVSDTDGRVATPIETVLRSGDRQGDHRRLLAIAAEWEVEHIVVGLPLSMDGSHGPAVRLVLDEVAQLRDLSPVPVDTYDERLTTVTAERSLRDLDLDAKARRKVIDQVAAAVLLQAWLDGHRSERGEPTPET